MNTKLFSLSFKLSALTVIIFSVILPFISIYAADDDDDDDGEDFEENNSITICCTWGDNLDDGILTYTIGGSVDAAKKKAVHDAIRDWDDKIDLVELHEISSVQEDTKRPDIQIRFINDGEEFKEEGPETAGNTKTKLDEFGFIKYNLITIAEGGLGRSFDIKTIETIAKHEIGHALGLGHANFKSNLMTTKIESAAETISSCELEAVRQANSWKLVDIKEDNTPELPVTTTVICKS